jgi:hypothetical protein
LGRGRKVRATPQTPKLDPLKEVENAHAQLREAIEQMKTLADKADKLVQHIKKALPRGSQPDLAQSEDLPRS